MILSPIMAFGGFGNSGHLAANRAGDTDDTIKPVAAALRITGIDAPIQLAVNQEGTWTIKASETSTSTLHYSVKWGDEGSLLTRAALSTPVATSSATFTHAYATKGTYTPTFMVSDDLGHSVSKTVSVDVGKNIVAHIASITPGSGAAGTSVTLAGSGFASSTVVHFGDKTIARTTITNAGTISFAIPSTTPAGTYKVWVKGNDTNKGKSNTVTFKVIATPTARLSVNGIDAPAALTVDQEGTWTVHASSNVAGNLHYSVVWGDENLMLRTMAAVLPQSVQTSATFTHAYGSEGTYQPKFTITDDAGHATTASASVHVTAQ